MESICSPPSPAPRSSPKNWVADDPVSSPLARGQHSPWFCPRGSYSGHGATRRSVAERLAPTRPLGPTSPPAQSDPGSRPSPSGHGRDSQADQPRAAAQSAKQLRLRACCSGARTLHLRLLLAVPAPCKPQGPGLTQESHAGSGRDTCWARGQLGGTALAWRTRGLASAPSTAEKGKAAHAVCSRRRPPRGRKSRARDAGVAGRCQVGRAGAGGGWCVSEG